MSKRDSRIEGMSGILKDLNITLPFSTENSTYKDHVKLEKATRSLHRE